MLNANKRSGLRILIVEDDAVMRTLVGRILQTNGFDDVVFAGTVNQTLETMKSAEPPVDVALIDINLGDDSGLDLIAAIKVQHNINDTPCVVMTSHRSEKIIEKAIELGIQGFVMKPVIPDKLVEAIEYAVRENADIQAVAMPRIF